jgi:iron complex transport system substrate-binding protein
MIMLKKKSDKLLLVVIAFVLLMFGAVSCTMQQAKHDTPSETEGGVRYPLTITDSAGKTVVLDGPVEKAVVLNSRVAEAMRLLGVQDRIIAVSDSIIESCKQFPMLSKKPSIGSGLRPCVETIVSFKPDVVFAWVRRPDPKVLQEDELEAAGIKVIRLDLYKAKTLLGEIKILGEIFDRKAELEAYIDWHDKYINLIKSRVATISEEDRVRVFIESDGAGKNPGTRRAMGGRSGIQELVTIAGGINIAADYIPKTSGDVETEWILAENPDVIIGREMRRAGGFETNDPADMREHYQEIKELPGFAEKVKAVVNNRVYIISSDVVGGPALPVGAAYLAKWFYPEKFEDLDPQAIHQEYIDKFWGGISYDVTAEGVFVYPPQK